MRDDGGTIGWVRRSVWGTSGVGGPDLMGRKSCHSQSTARIHRRVVSPRGVTNHKAAISHRGAANHKTAISHRGAANHKAAISRSGAANHSGAAPRLGLRRRLAGNIVQVNLLAAGLQVHPTGNPFMSRLPSPESSPCVRCNSARSLMARSRRSAAMPLPCLAPR